MTKPEYRISNYVKIRSGAIFLDGKELFAVNEDSGKDFLKQAYQHLEINYPKYFKMDRLCKLGILATEVLFRKKKPVLNTALVFSNSSSSLDTDFKHQASMAEIVSPAVFVYTLPNIVIGEISIRHKLQSENAFFVEDKFNAELVTNYSEILLRTGKATAVVSGWIDLKNDEYDVFLCHISAEGNLPFSEENIEHLYNFENE